MLKKLTAVALCATSLAVASEKTIAAKHLVESSRRHIVTHGENGFKVNNQEVDLYLDRSLKGISKVKLAKLLASDRAQLHVRTIEDQYGLDLKHTLKGGGAGGAWLGSWLGYAGVITGSKLITAAIVYPIAIACPPAGIVVGAALDTVLTVVAQPIAITAGVAGGIALGTATGPI